jgi:protein transport protein SEC61 subunit gamma-like protein
MLTRLKSFAYECIRVFKVTKKPSGDEFKAVVKVSGIGILLIGLIGFLIQMIWQMIM